MPQSLIKLRICAGDSLFRDMRVKLKNIEVSTLRSLYLWDAKLTATCSLRTRTLTNVILLFCLRIYFVGALGLSYY